MVFTKTDGCISEQKEKVQFEDPGSKVGTVHNGFIIAARWMHY